MTTTPTEPFEVKGAPPPPVNWLAFARGFAGAVVGAIAGYFLFYWLYKNGLYAIMVPGMLLGLAAGWAARGKSSTLGIVCAIAAVAVGIYSEWTIGPFKKDPSLPFFITHVHHLPVVKLLMMGLGAAAAYWFGQGR